jgi:large subunit ribosomal protein L6
MSRVAKMPVNIPAGVQVTTTEGLVTVKGGKSTLTLPLPEAVAVEVKGNVVSIAEGSVKGNAMQSGTIRALINNMVEGVTKGYQKKLQLVGVGYRAAAQGKKINLSLGFSHPVEYPIPEGITVETPTQTEILVKGADKHLVGQVAADIRAFRPPEPYKGKGVRYSDERVELKEAKKK